MAKRKFVTVVTLHHSRADEIVGVYEDVAEAEAVVDKMLAESHCHATTSTATFHPSVRTDD